MGEVSQVLWISGKLFLIDSGKWAANYGMKSSNKLKKSRNHEKLDSKSTGINNLHEKEELEKFKKPV